MQARDAVLAFTQALDRHRPDAGTAVTGQMNRNKAGRTRKVT